MHLGSQGDVFITSFDLQEGMLEELPMPIMDLTVNYFKGKELYPIVEKACKKFLFDNNFIKSRAFIQLAFRSSISNFEERCSRKRQTKQPNKEEHVSKDEIKKELM